MGIDNLIQKEANIKTAWESEFFSIVEAHIKKYGWGNVDILKKEIADKMPKYGVESLKEGVKYLNEKI